MDTRFRIYLGVLVALLVLYAVAESQRPPELRWDHTYQNQDKIPFGTYALVELLPDLFGTDEVTITREPIINQIQNHSPPTGDYVSERKMVKGKSVMVQDTTHYTFWQMTAADSSSRLEEGKESTTKRPHAIRAYNYLVVTPQLEVDSSNLQKLLSFAAAGHHVFLAADNLPDNLLSRLGLVQQPYLLGGRAVPPADTVRLQFAGDSTSRAYRFARGDISVHFRQASPRPNPALTTLAADAAGRAVLVRVRRGFGDITLCSVPTAFTNYFVLRPQTAGFAWQALSSLPPGPVWWDEYTKQGRAGSDSLLRVVFKHPALKAGFWLLLAGGLLLLFVHGRRRQRVIPVLKPLPNNTLQFVRTVAGLYRQGDNHAAIAHRKIDLFLDFLRVRYKEPTDDLTAETFRALLTQKSGLPRADVNELLRRISGVRASSYVSDGELLWLSQTLSEFRRR
ncbi:MAG: hypothetical protein H7330_13270 [Hymenobacteraceae bacterium]|nr:hypothetical protein [Hymenobacteraceae bacterium]